MDPKKKFFLFKQSRNFCSVPWNHFKIYTNGSVHTCVNGHEVLGNIHDQPIQDILNNPALVDIRRELAQDLRSSNCTLCQKLENTEDYSYKFLRDLYNPMFVKSTADYDNNHDFVLNGVDLHWGSTCNLKCITCQAESSSAIAQELGQPIQNVSGLAAEGAIDFMVKNQHTLKEIYLSGGEPTLIKHNLNLLRRLRHDLDFVIRINTNMTFADDNPIIAELKKFPKVLVTISADALTNRFDYIRRGADWSVFMHNLEQLKKLHFNWRVNTVFFVATALHLPDTQEFFMDNFDIQDFTINQVSMGHTDIRCRNLPAALKPQVIERLQQHQEKHKLNLNLHGQLKNCLDEVQQESTESYVPFFESVDARAGTNWRDTFAELV